jgi:hypothetical protein
LINGGAAPERPSFVWCVLKAQQLTEMEMAKNTLSKSGSAGGGFRSRQVREVGNRPGRVAERVNPGGVSQIGEALGNHSTENRTVSNYRGDKMIAGQLVRPGQPRLGNEVAFTTQCGVGGSRNLYGQSGTQAQHGPVAGEPKPAGRGFDSRSTITKV